MDPRRAARRRARSAPRRGSAAARATRWIREQSASDPLQVAILSVDPRNGGVRALVGGSDFRRSPFDRTSQMRRQPGSAFKTFAYLAAIASKRATTASLLLDSPVKVELSDDEVWEPQNYDERFRGRVTLRESFERSLNVPTVRLTQTIGLRRVANTAKGFGFRHVEARAGHAPRRRRGLDARAHRRLHRLSRTSASASSRSSCAASPVPAARRSSSTRSSRRSASPTPTLRTSCTRSCAASCAAARPRASSATASATWPARPARRTTTATPGSSATPRTSSPPSGSASTAARRCGSPRPKPRCRSGAPT